MIAGCPDVACRAGRPRVSNRSATLLSVLHEDDDLLVVDKPADLVVHPGKEGPESCLIGRARLYLGHAEARLVHRLDRETSGVVVMAKSRTAAGELGRLFAGGTVAKEYVAIVHGAVPPEGLVIDAPLGRDAASPVAIKDVVRADGAPARTRVELVRHLTRDELRLSFVRVVPETGRKHQIRIHLAYAGYPIVGDKLYGGDETCYLRFVERRLTDDDRRRLVLDAHALHAATVAFTWRDREWRFEAPLRADMVNLLQP